MKKMLLIFLLVLFICGCKSKMLFDLEEYKDISLDNITSIEKIRYTLVGDDPTVYTTPEDIRSIYNYLSNIKLGGKTKIACEDNSTIYILNMKDDSKKTINFECNVLVLKNVRYLVN